VITYTVFGEEVVASMVCKICGEEKPINQFGEHHRKSDNAIVRDSRCMKCKSNQSKHVKYLRSISPPQPLCCELCGKRTKKFDLDHDHDTGEFRGWLCGPCNKSLGHFGDSVEGLQKAILYLETHRMKQHG
jgi:hypothetical protein